MECIGICSEFANNAVRGAIEKTHSIVQYHYRDCAISADSRIP